MSALAHVQFQSQLILVEKAAECGSLHLPAALTSGTTVPAPCAPQPASRMPACYHTVRKT
jgi:hypothetical protein